MQDLSWDDLRTFLEVARAGTLAAGAKALGVHPSTALRRLAVLEAALAGQLFDRGPRGYRLTPVGEALRPVAEQMEANAHAAARVVLGHDNQVRGIARLTLVPSLVPIIVPLLAELKQTAPALEVSLRVSAEELALGTQTDVALRMSASPPESAVGRKMGPVEWAVYGQPNADSWVIYRGADQIPAARWRQKHHPDVPVMLSVDSVAAMQQALIATHAQGLLPCYLGDPTPTLKRLSPVIEPATNTLWMLIHADLRSSARVRALVDFLAPRLCEALLP